MSDYQGTTTTNLGLTMDSENDNYSVERVNANTQKIDDWSGNVTTQLSDLTYQVAGGTATAITLAMQSLVNGYAKTFIASVNNSGAATTINGKKLYKPGTTAAPDLIAGKAYTVWYNQSSDCFFIKASAEGDALAANVLAGKKFSNDNDTGLVGTLDLGNLVSGNIKSGVTINGVSGSGTVVDTADAFLDPQYLLTGYSGYDDGVKKNGGLPNYANATISTTNHHSAMTVTVDPNDARMGIIDMPNDIGPSTAYINSSSRIKAQLWGLIPSNIISGAVIGQYPGYGSGYMTGTATVQSLGGKGYATGTYPSQGADGNIIINLSFTPSVVYVTQTEKTGVVYKYMAVNNFISGIYQSGNDTHVSGEISFYTNAFGFHGGRLSFTWKAYE